MQFRFSFEFIVTSADVEWKWILWWDRLLHSYFFFIFTVDFFFFFCLLLSERESFSFLLYMTFFFGVFSSLFLLNDYIKSTYALFIRTHFSYPFPLDFRTISMVNLTIWHARVHQTSRQAQYGIKKNKTKRNPATTKKYEEKKNIIERLNAALTVHQHRTIWGLLKRFWNDWKKKYWKEIHKKKKLNLDANT